MSLLLALLAPLSIASTAAEPASTAPEPASTAAEAAPESASPDRLDPVELHAWARAGYAVESDGDTVSHGPYLSMARLKATVDHQDRYGVTVHLAADRGELRLVDAKAYASLIEGVHLTMGRMKIPVSHDFLVPVQEMLLPTRALLDRLGPARAVGLQLSARTPTPVGGLRVRLGVFDPHDGAFDGLSGARIVSQAALHHPDGWFAHAAGALWLQDGSELPPVAELKHPWDATGDLALGFEDDRLSLHVEGLVSRLVHDGALQVGATGMAGVRFEVEHEHHIVLEPVAAYDLREDGQDLTHRGTLAVNVHEDGWHLLQTLAVEVEKVGDQPVGTRVMMQIQAGL